MSKKRKFSNDDTEPKIYEAPDIPEEILMSIKESVSRSEKRSKQPAVWSRAHKRLLRDSLDKYSESEEEETEEVEDLCTHFERMTLSRAYNSPCQEYPFNSDDDY